MTSPLFDTNFISRRKERAAGSPVNDNGHFLANWSLKEAIERLNDLTRTFDNTIIHGDFFDARLLDTPKIKSFTHVGLTENVQVRSNSECLPYKQHSLDLIISLFEMHRLNDPVGYLIQSLYALRPDGLFVAAFPGEGSLHELRHCLSMAEEKLKGGVSPRTLPLMSKQDAGHLMQRAGFNLPVIDSETVKLSYTSLEKLYNDIRNVGGGNTLTSRNKAYCGRNFFPEVEKCYHNHYMDKDGHYEATMEIIFMSGWAPHENQQKPLPRGSGQTSLTDIL